VPDQSASMCPRCQIGYCQPGEITYVRMYDGMLLTVPHTQVFTCDVCGYREFGTEAFQRIQALEMGILTSGSHPQAVPKPATADIDIVDSQEIKTTRHPKS